MNMNVVCLILNNNYGYYYYLYFINDDVRASVFFSRHDFFRLVLTRMHDFCCCSYPAHTCPKFFFTPSKKIVLAQKGCIFSFVYYI